MGMFLYAYLHRETLYLETMGDHLMRSAHSSRLNPFHVSNYHPNKFNPANSSYNQSMTKMEKLEETIKSQKSFNLPVISRIYKILYFRQTYSPKLE